MAMKDSRIARSLARPARRWAAAALVAGLALAAGFGSQAWQARQWNSRLADAEAVAAAARAEAAGVAGAAEAAGSSAAAASQAPAAPAAASVVVPGDASAAASGAASGPAAPAAWLDDGRPLAWRFAVAGQLGEQGQIDAALARYRSLFQDPALGLAARYNSANLLLRQGRRLLEAGDKAPALVFLELAKQAYRGVLNLEPLHWEARYNLERAQRLLPDPAPEDLPEAAQPEQAERAATTMRGVSKGLP
jgi:mxaK protein